MCEAFTTQRAMKREHDARESERVYYGVIEGTVVLTIVRLMIFKVDYQLFLSLSLTKFLSLPLDRSLSLNHRLSSSSFLNSLKFVQTLSLSLSLSAFFPPPTQTSDSNKLVV